METYPTRLRKWTRAEYERLIEIGVFHPAEPIELLGGELMVREPQGSAHYTAIGLVEDALRAELGPGWLVRSQGPIALTEDSEPEPDVAVIRGSRRDYGREHPARPAPSHSPCLWPPGAHTRRGLRPTAPHSTVR